MEDDRIPRSSRRRRSRPLLSGDLSREATAPLLSTSAQRKTTTKLHLGRVEEGGGDIKSSANRYRKERLSSKELFTKMSLV